MTNLWPHQVKGLQLVREEFKNGHKWVVLVMSTGAGKTVAGAALIRAHLEKVPTGKILWIAHRDELLAQAYDTLTDLGLSCGVIQANPSRPVNPHRSVQIASIQTIVARKLVVEGVTFVITDECHHMPAESWGTPVLLYKQEGTFGVGLTATPVRADGLPLGDTYDAIVCPITMAQLIEQGFLVPYELIRPGKTLKKQQIAQRPVDAWQKHATGRKTILFAANIVAATLFRDEFLAAGVTSEIVTGSMDAGKRRQVFERYKDGKTQVLCNVGICTEGFDDRPTSCVIIARSVGSISLYLQMVGRGLRISPETGKTNASIIDLYGSSHRHGPPDEDRVYTLDGDGIHRKNLPACPERFCAICGLTLEADTTVCSECGTAPQGQRPPEVVNAALVKYARMRKRGDTERAADLKKWLHEAKTLKQKPGRAFYKYKAVYGDWPTPEISQIAKFGVLHDLA